MSIVTAIFFASHTGKIELLSEKNCESFPPRANF